MNLGAFLERYTMTADLGNEAGPPSVQKNVDEDFVFCMSRLGGKTFNDGIYRFYRWDQIQRATEVVKSVFVATEGPINIFAADWLGRQFGVNSGVRVHDKPTVDCFDLAGPDSFHTDQSIIDFHNKALAEKAHAALAEKFYERWKMGYKQPLTADVCAGYRVPLFLGGEDDVHNLEVVDMDVYLELCSQLWNRVKGLPDGTPIRDILIGDLEKTQGEKRRS
jgi:hypothetical protein